MWLLLALILAVPCHKTFVTLVLKFADTSVAGAIIKVPAGFIILVKCALRGTKISTGKVAISCPSCKTLGPKMIVYLIP